VRVLLRIQGALLILQACEQQCMLVRCAMCACAAAYSGRSIDPAGMCAAVHVG